MNARDAARIVAAGLLGGLAGNGVLGGLFTSPPIHALLYNPIWQSPLFLDVTPRRDIPVSVAGLVVLSVFPAWLFAVLAPSIPARTWLGKGVFWGFTIWLTYWLPQEWFIYHTLLGEPLLLNVVELVILLLGSLVEGVVISYVLGRWNGGAGGDREEPGVPCDGIPGPSS